MVDVIVQSPNPTQDPLDVRQTDLDSNPWPSRCEATVLTTKPPCWNVFLISKWKTFQLFFPIKAIKTEVSTVANNDYSSCNHSVPFPIPIIVLNAWIVTPLFMTCEELNSQPCGCQHLRSKKAQTVTTTTWRNLLKSNKDLSEKSCPRFPHSIQSKIQASSSPGAAGCQIRSRRACSKMHVQPLCQEVDVPVMTKSSLRQQVHLT